ncbi:hypothetical protein KM043_012733 [Ampulex compressa]|nr:hypothetical protein KM043_012733 [Ampulex compressa]
MHICARIFAWAWDLLVGSTTIPMQHSVGIEVRVTNEIAASSIEENPTRDAAPPWTTTSVPSRTTPPTPTNPHPQYLSPHVFQGRNSLCSANDYTLRRRRPMTLRIGPRLSLPNRSTSAPTTTTDGDWPVLRGLDEREEATLDPASSRNIRYPGEESALNINHRVFTRKTPGGRCCTIPFKSQSTRIRGWSTKTASRFSSGSSQMLSKRIAPFPRSSFAPNPQMDSGHEGVPHAGSIAIDAKRRTLVGQEDFSRNSNEAGDRSSIVEGGEASD